MRRPGPPSERTCERVNTRLPAFFTSLPSCFGCFGTFLLHVLKQARLGGGPLLADRTAATSLQRGSLPARPVDTTKGDSEGADAIASASFSACQRQGSLMPKPWAFQNLEELHVIHKDDRRLDMRNAADSPNTDTPHKDLTLLLPIPHPFFPSASPSLSFRFGGPFKSLRAFGGFRFLAAQSLR